MNNGDEQAFPVGVPENGYKYDGLTKREYFAGLAMQGMLSNSYYAEPLRGNSPFPVPNQLAKYALELADALLKELENE